MADKMYKSIDVSFYEEGLGRGLRADLDAYSHGTSKWSFSTWGEGEKEKLLKDISLKELLELIELGIFCKAHLSDLTLKHTVSRRRKGKSEPEMETVEQAAA